MITTKTEQRYRKRSMEFIWPDNKRFAVCLTHDVDRIKKTYQYITKSKNGNIRQIRQLFTSGKGSTILKVLNEILETSDCEFG